MINLVFALLLTISSISRAETPNGVYVRYLVVSSEPVSIGGVYLSRNISEVQDPATGEWRTTIQAVLPACTGRLTVDGATVVQQRCVYMPRVANA